jgi:hypothetical protein
MRERFADVLVATKPVSRGEQHLARYPVLRRIGLAPGDMEQHADEVKGVRSSLSG